MANLIPDLRFKISGAARAGEAPTAMAETDPTAAVVTVAMFVRNDLLLAFLLSTENAFPPAAQSRIVTSEVLDTILSVCFILAWLLR